MVFQAPERSRTGFSSVVQRQDFQATQGVFMTAFDLPICSEFSFIGLQSSIFFNTTNQSGMRVSIILCPNALLEINSPSYLLIG
jgi:hypothetical protein